MEPKRKNFIAITKGTIDNIKFVKSMDRVFTKFTEADKDYNNYVTRSRSQSHVEITREKGKKTYVGLMINDKKLTHLRANRGEK